MYTFEAKIRLAGSSSYVQVTARDSAQARKLIQAQYGNAVTILQTKRLR
jgi:flagellar biosynthesis GTPase FlhF